jgi:hypothetical protein
MRPIAYGVAHFCKNKRGTGVGVPYEGFYWFGTKRDSGGVGEADAAPQIFDRGGGRGVRAGRQSGVSLRSTIRSDGQGDPVHGHGRRSGDADACLFGVSCRVVWKPDRIDDVPLQQRWDAHDKITEAWGPERKRVKHHHVFLRLPGEEKFLYAGQAHLGSYSAAEAEFTLEEKLPRSEWLRLRGYTGWLIDLNHRSERVDKDDLDSFRRLTAEIAGQEISHLRMTRFEEDVLGVHINARRGWLLYQRDPADYSYCGRDPAETGLGEGDELFRCGCCGIVLDCPADHTVPRDLAIQVAEHFFSVGELPRTLSWRAD